MQSFNELKYQWKRLLPTELLPGDEQFNIWLSLYDAKMVASAITQLAIKHKKLNGVMERDYVIRFASAVMSRLYREQRSKLSIRRTTVNQETNSSEHLSPDEETLTRLIESDPEHARAVAFIAQYGEDATFGDMAKAVKEEQQKNAGQ